MSLISPITSTANQSFAIRHRLAIAFISLAMCIAGVIAAWHMSSSVFPQTNFPRVVLLVDNGVMPADEMMAAITRPIEEAMKDVPGTVSIRSATGRGSAEVNVFFDWSVDMVEAELFVLNRLAQIRSTLPSTATATVWRLTFAAFPIVGVSLTSKDRDITQLWEKARYDLKPKLLRIPGVARVDIVGGREPEYHVVVDQHKLRTHGIALTQVVDAINRNNLVIPAGMHEENHTLYLAVVEDRVKDAESIGNVIIIRNGEHAIRIADVATIERGPEPVFNAVTADGVNAVLLNIRSQPDGSTLHIADGVRQVIQEVQGTWPTDLHLGCYYDQSIFVENSVSSVWEAIGLGLILSIVIIFLFLRSVGGTLTAVVVIPVTILITMVIMLLCGLTFNLMTLGGIAAAVGLVIDDAIVVVEAIAAKAASGRSRLHAVTEGLEDIYRPLIASTLTPVVVLIPLAFLSGITGVFFRALAITMVVSLLTSLVLAITLTPALMSWFIRSHHHGSAPEKPLEPTYGHIFSRLLHFYERVARVAIRHYWISFATCLMLVAIGYRGYQHLETDFLPAMDEGGFVIDYQSPWGTSLSETDRQLHVAETILRDVPEVESYSRRTGARLALAIAEPNTGDFLVKLKVNRQRDTESVINELRERFLAAVPGIEWEFPGILSDLVGDLTWSPKPIEIKIFSTDQPTLEKMARHIEAVISEVHGVVDADSGLIYAGPTLSVAVRQDDARRYGFSTTEIATAINTAMLGQVTTPVLQGDRLINIRVTLDPKHIMTIADFSALLLTSPNGVLIPLIEIADIHEKAGLLELRREDLRQCVAVTADLSGRDLGSAMQEIRSLIAADNNIPQNMIEFGGLYQQQQESFHNLLLVLGMAIVLVFTVLLIEFSSFKEPVAIVAGAILSLLGSVFALWLTDTTLNVVSFLGAIIGLGVVAKNGILLLDGVEQQRIAGKTLDDAIIAAGRRRLRPVLMTSLAAALGMLPLAYGLGTGADMLKPLAIAVIGALCVSVLLALIATPALFALLASKKISH